MNNKTAECFCFIKIKREQIFKVILTEKTDFITFLFRTFATKINEKEEKMKADSITSPIRKQGFRASMTVKW